MDPRSITRDSACRTAGSESSGCLVLTLERSPSTSVHGSVWFTLMCSMFPDTAKSTRPLPPCSIRFRMSSSTWRFQAKSYSPVWSTARAAEAASPPPFISTRSKNGQFGTW